MREGERALLALKTPGGGLPELSTHLREVSGLPEFPAIAVLPALGKEGRWSTVGASTL